MDSGISLESNGSRRNPKLIAILHPRPLISYSNQSCQPLTLRLKSFLKKFHSWSLNWQIKPPITKNRRRKLKIPFNNKKNKSKKSGNQYDRAYTKSSAITKRNLKKKTCNKSTKNSSSPAKPVSNHSRKWDRKTVKVYKMPSNNISGSLLQIIFKALGM